MQRQPCTSRENSSASNESSACSANPTGTQVQGQDRREVVDPTLFPELKDRILETQDNVSEHGLINLTGVTV